MPKKTITSKSKTKSNVTIKKKTTASTKIKSTVSKKRIQPKTSIKATNSIKVSLMDYSYLKRKPFSHQIEAATFLLDKKKAILADDMGAGKTFSSILALNSIPGRKLIVCPASLKLNWKKEIQLISNASINIISGKKWIKPSRTKNSWTIINYDILGNHIEDIKSAGFVVVAFDEAHFCKKINNHGKPDSKRAKFFMRIANQIEYVFILTGTPISNKTRDIFNLLKAIKHPLSKDFKSFAQRYCAPEFNGYGYSYDGSSNQEELNEQLQGFMLRRLKRDLLELPEKTRSFIPVEINKNQYLKDMNKYMDAKSHFTNKGQHLMLLNSMRHNLAKEKSKELIKMIENLLEQNKPVVVFTNFTYVANAVKNKFKNAVSITGEDNQEEREHAIESFQSGKTNVIVCNLIAGGTGVTLTRAKNMLINDMDWNPSTHMQAEERIFRIGQVSDVIVEYLYSDGTFDEKMALLLDEKLKNINKIIDGNDEGFLDEVINWLN